jgi:two-component system cell cycle sensor histidine kinase/response regulator CckA
MLEAKNQTAYPQELPPNWESHFRELLENVHLTAMMLDVEGRITFCNTYLLQLTGWDEAHVRGCNWFDLFIPAEERGTIFDLFTAGIRDERFPAHHQNAITTRSGQRRMIRWNNTVLRGLGGRITGCASIGEDITDMLLLEQQYRQAQKLESVGRLAGGVAHDFNNLLTVINGYADLLLSRVAEHDPFSGSVLEIRKAGERAASLTRQLLTFSRSQPVDVRPIDLNQVVADQANLLRRLVGEDIELSMSSAPGLGAVIADPSQIQQVLMNLAVNSRDAMPSGGRLTIDISAADSLEAGTTAVFPEVGAGPYVVLTVSDTGTGMSDDVRAQAFDPFFTTKPAGQGTGLGLSIVYGIVRQFRGWISLQSEPGSGTSFRIGFPRTEEAVSAEPAACPSVVLGGTETVLLVEDQEEVRRFTSVVLRRLGYRVLDAGSAGDAILIAEQHPGLIHLILTDVVMPRMNGCELVRRLAPFRPEMHVLYMSGYPGDAIAECGVFEMGPCIAKPFTPEQLAQKVRAVLGGAALPRILVVDDDEAIRRLFCKVLQEQGYPVAVAADGREAIASVVDHQEDFGLIIIDLVMPESEGIETICCLRKHRPNIKILAVSGAFKRHLLDTTLTCASMLGADATLLKPVRPEDLVATVRTLLGLSVSPPLRGSTEAS